MERSAAATAELDSKLEADTVEGICQHSARLAALLDTSPQITQLVSQLACDATQWQLQALLSCLPNNSCMYTLEKECCIHSQGVCVMLTAPAYWALGSKLTKLEISSSRRVAVWHTGYIIRHAGAAPWERTSGCHSTAGIPSQHW
jgi:hypothetical protein